MKRYKIYISDETSAVTDIEEVWCATKDEAITTMIDLAGRNAAEVWLGDHRISALPSARGPLGLFQDLAFEQIRVPACMARPWTVDPLFGTPGQL
jgi:hypothetical protein